MTQLFFTILICLSITFNVFAQDEFDAMDDEWNMDGWEEEESKDYSINGFLEVAAGIRLSKDSVISTDKTLADLRLQFQYDYQFDASELSFTADTYYDGVQDQTRAQIREAAWQSNLGFAGDWGSKFDVKLGQQVLTWGTGDYVFLNDLFPKDYQSFFSGRDDEYLKAPSLSAKLSGYFDLVNIDLVITPSFTPDVYINGDYFSFFSPLAGQQIAPRFDVSSSLKPSSPEYAVRLYKSIGATEYAGYFYNGYFKTPSSITEAFEPTFSKLKVYGASVRSTLGVGLFNAEFAYYDSVDDSNGTNPYVPNSQSRWLIGYEQELVKNLTGSMQWYLEHTHDHAALIDHSFAPEYEVAQNRVWFTQRLMYRAMQQTLTINAFNFYSTTDNDGYLKLSASYSPVDTWQLTAGANIFYGEEGHTFFGQFEDATNIFARFRYFY